jgi:hypothetical protein
MTRASALRAKDAAVLEAGQEGIMAEAARKRTQQQKFQAMQMAKRSGDADLVSQIQNGTLAPEAYLKHKMDKKELYELSRGEMLTDKDGNIIRLNPAEPKTKGTDPFRPSVHTEKQFDELSLSSNQAEAQANQVSVLADNIQKSEWRAGLYATMDDFLRTQFGSRDKVNAYRTEVTRIRNSEAIANLPKGPASDRDVALVLAGEPPINSPKEEIVEYLRAVERVARGMAEYDKMKAQYVITGRRSEFQEDWDEKIERKAYQERVDATPAAAVQFVQQNPEHRDDFIAKYGWDPIPNG